MGNDPSSAIMLNNGIQMTTQGGNMMSNMVVLDEQAKDINGTIQEGNEGLGNTKRAKSRLRDLEGLRASQSFDDSVLLVDTEPSNVSRSSSANNKVIKNKNDNDILIYEMTNLYICCQISNDV